MPGTFTVIVINIIIAGVILAEGVFAADPYIALQHTYNSREIRNIEKFYSVATGPFSEAEWETGSRLQDSLDNLGHIVFTKSHRQKETEALFRTILAGCYRDSNVAGELAMSLRRKGYNSAAIIEPFTCTKNDSMTVIQTPRALWLLRDETNELLFRFPGKPSEFTQPFFAPQGDKVLFELGDSIYVVDLPTRNVHTLQPYGGVSPYKGEIENSFPQLSPSGKYVAYIANNEWEGWSSLCVIPESDSSFILIDAFNPPIANTRESAVKNFRWHPKEDVIFFVMGYGAGTIRVGGDIYCVDMSGNCRLSLSADKANREEITMNISIERDTLTYEVVHWDEEYCYFVDLEKKTANVDDLLNVFRSR